jgi:hypothetical protein
MKTIELPDHLADSLIATGKELAVQNNLGTAWPIWYVESDVYVYTSEELSHYKERKDDDAIDPDEDLCPECLALWSISECPAQCDSWKCENSFVYYNIERQYNSYGSCFFLTRKACKEYIEQNKHHFMNPRPYADSAFRNDEIQPIIQALILAAGEKVPSNHYGYVKD